MNLEKPLENTMDSQKNKMIVHQKKKKEKEINPLETQMTRFKLSYFGRILQRPNFLEKALMLGQR